MTMPLVSVVTAVRNGERFIGETMASIFSQQDVDVDYVVVDGGSVDKTLEIVRANEHRLAGLISEPDQGISDAFNKGLSSTRGDYIMFLNADDALAHPRALAEMLQYVRCLLYTSDAADE